MQCPGQDSRYWTGSAVFETACEKCGHPLEFFKDDSTRVCKNCGHRMLNPKIDFGCASYCPYASQCLGELPPELLKKKQEELVEQVAVAIKQRLGQDFKAIGHAGRVARRAGELAHNREGTNPAVLNIAAYLHTLYRPEAAAEAEREQEIRALLAGLDANPGLADEVCAAIRHLYAPQAQESNPNLLTLADAHRQTKPSTANS